MHHLLIRRATDVDAQALRHLAQLDSQDPVAGPVLMAEVDGEVLAALSLQTGQAIADPFRRTATIVDALRLRAGSADRSQSRRRFKARRRLTPRLAGATARAR